ncbi:hypothetical protein [Catenuloplanes japonicus]|uniref:hypothetical protein n=1 Tax=Catenuloplanes japonicus TaxID=33876 RepID=UPI000525A4A5|nr:hypothetical protein [Catenuloplanes japonicus]
MTATPTVLDAAQLAGAAEDGESCPTCAAPPTTGTLSFDDRGPYQQISVRTYACPDGHTWRSETDGG